VWWKQVSSNFSSDELRACVRIVERDWAFGMRVGVDWDVGCGGWSWDRRSAKEGSSVLDFMPLIC
jgi:hypothetical protein